MNQSRRKSDSRRRQSSLSTARGLVYRGDQYKDRENHPERKVLPVEQRFAQNPEPLPRMQNPGGKKSDQRCYRHRRDRADFPQLEMSWIKEELHYEVLPINVNAAPEVGEACREVIQMVGLGKIKTKHV